MKLKKLDYIILGFLVTIILITIVTFIIWFINNRTNKLQLGEISKYEKHNYDLNKLKKDENNFFHYEDDNYYSLVGIDVSEHNDDIDFKEVKKQGVDFVYLRLGWRGYTEGLKHLDSKFEEYYKKAKDAGLLIGVYFYSQAKNRGEALEEARMVIENIKDKEIDLPVCMDYEMADDEDNRLVGLTKEEYTENAKTFLDHIKSCGYIPILYTNLDWLNNKYNLDVITNYYIWYAGWDSLPKYPYKFQIWQYSTNGKVNGINKNVDLNILFVPKNLTK